MSIARRLATLALAVTSLAVVAAGPAAAFVPTAPNDAFADAIAIPASSLPYVWEGDTTGATTELDEPGSPCQLSSTVWFTFRSAKTVFVKADSVGTGGSRLVVYRGGSLGSLTLIDCDNDDNDDGSDSRVAWRAKAGVTYRIRLRSSEVNAVLRLRKVPPPANDDFANAKLVTSFPSTFRTDLMNSSRQDGEPQPTCATGGGASIWYAIKSPVTRTIQVDTLLASMDTYLILTTGTKVGALTTHLCSDDISEVGTGSRITFKALAGKTYRVLVGGYSGAGGELQVRVRSVTPPANDSFANAATLPQNGSLKLGDTTNATIQTGEPLTALGCTGEDMGATVWYTFVASTSAGYTVDALGSSPDVTLGVYSGGPGLGALNPIACDGSNEIDFTVVDGTRYWVQVGGSDAESGRIHVHLYNN